MSRRLYTSATVGLIALGLLAPLAPASAATTTAVTLVVQGCEGCTVGVVRAIGGDSKVKLPRPEFWDGGFTKVVGGRATFNVPTAYTSGLSFTIAAPWEGDTGAVANIVLGNGVAGKRLSEKQAKSRKKATACWAGTTASEVTIPVTVGRVKIRGMMGPAVMALAWANPSVPTVGDLQPAYSGTLGNQDAFSC